MKKIKTKIPVKVLKIDNDGFHLLAEIKINRKKAYVIIDTGASRTVFDKELIKKFVKAPYIKMMDKLSTGLGTNSMESHQVKISSLRLGGILIKNYAAVLLDLTHVNRSYEQLGLDEIDGVLGSDILYEYHAVIDFGKNFMELKK